MSDKVTVAVRHVSRSYWLTKNGSEFGLTPRSRRREVKALQDVSLLSKSGESIGLIGANGAGKSTLLRIIAGNEAPSKGDVLVSQKPTLLGVSSALQPHLSGSFNVRLGLLAMGLSKEEAIDLEKPVLEWAAIGDASNRPMSTYSSGMKARLVFSISTAVRRELLLVDEALSTGDSAFASKARERMQTFLDGSGTVFLVSHGAGTIKEYCTRALWLHQGRVILDGPSSEVSAAYVRWSKRVSAGKTEEAERTIDIWKSMYSPPDIVFDSEAVRSLNEITLTR